MALTTELAEKPRASWIANELGVALSDVTARFRNPAAHLEVLDESHYRTCHDTIAGDAGLLWRLVESGL